MMTRHLPFIAVAGIAGIAGLTLATALPASAATTAKTVVVYGRCSGTSHDNLQVQREDTGKLSVDFGVDMARHVAGVVWTVKESDNGTAFVNRSVQTIRDGSFSITRTILPKPGTNTITATASNPGTGETCSLTASV
jgi:hypothetical protein